jgi:putative inorganic carbon (HCO3(-)) transporter
LTAFPVGRSVVSFEWAYVLLTVAAFVFTPELRRILDWRGNYDPINIISVVPLLMLCPVAVLGFRRRRQLRSRGFALVTVTWAAAFAYATFIATAHGATTQAIYGVAEYCLPISVGLWLMTRRESMETAHARIAHMLLTFGAVAGAYGIFQYIVAPPWDTAWMQNIGNDSFGLPERFGIRVFGVLNEPQVFALFLVSVILFNLPYLRVRNWQRMFALFIMVVALALSLVRSAWVAALVGIVIFIWLSPRRLQALLSLTSVAVVCVVVVLTALLVWPDANTSNVVSKRFTTFSDVQDDFAVQDRQQTAESALQTALAQLAGGGLGLTGESGKLGDADSQSFSGAPVGPIDNGFVSRFLEMGIVGFGAFVAACVASIVVLARAHATAVRARDKGGMLVSASCLAVVVVLFGVNLDGDFQRGLFGVLYFAALALPLRQPNPGTNKIPPRGIRASKSFSAAAKLSSSSGVGL